VHNIYEPVGGLTPVLANHDVDVRGATVVVPGVDGSHLHHTIRISVPTAAEPALGVVEGRGIVCAVLAG